MSFKRSIIILKFIFSFCIAEFEKDLQLQLILAEPGDTITIKENEWEEVSEWMWENRSVYNGLSVLPYSDHSYVQAPFEDCSKETYEALRNCWARNHWARSHRSRTTAAVLDRACTCMDMNLFEAIDFERVCIGYWARSR